jgi:hypothetical protein
MRKVLLTALVVVMPSAFAQAGVLGVYNFEGVYTPSSVVTGVMLSPVTTTAPSSAFYYYGSTGEYYDGYRAIYGAYLGFQVTLAPGAALNLNSMMC